MSASGGISFIRQATRLFSSPGGAIVGGLTAIFTAGTIETIRAGRALFSVFTNPVQTLADGTAAIVGAITGGAAGVVGAGAQASIQWLLNLGAFSVAGFPLGIVIIAAGMYVLGWILARGATSDAIPFTFTDFPLIGVDESEEEIAEED